jgi:hypothetical protein
MIFKAKKPPQKTGRGFLLRNSLEYEQLTSPYTGEIVASAPIKMVNTRNPPRKNAILPMGPPTL